MKSHEKKESKAQEKKEHIAKKIVRRKDIVGAKKDANRMADSQSRI